MSGTASFSWTLPPGPPLTEAQRALVVEALPLAPAVVRRLLGESSLARRYEDELQGLAHDGAIRAAQKYDPSRGAWAGFAYGGMLVRCRQWLRGVESRAHREWDDATPLNVAPDPGSGADELLHRHQVLALVERLPARERVGVCRHLDGATLEEVGRAHGVSREAVRKWEAAGFRRLRAWLDNSNRAV